jgi:ABC-type transport system involved in multi-copper enzyme maturation permease subunit
MTAMIRNLAWKEFREQRWDAFWAAAVTLVIPLYYVFRDPGTVQFTVHVALLVYPLLAGTLFGMRLAAAERSSRTAALLYALPVRPSILGAAKIAIASLAVLVPLGLLLVVAVAATWLDNMPPATADLGWTHWTWIFSALCSLAVLLLVGMVGAGAVSEVHAAMRGALALAVLLFAIVLMNTWLSIKSPEAFARWTEPVALVPLLSLVVFVLAATMVASYVRTLRPLQSSRGGWVEWRGWAPSRLGSPLAALAWKDGREAASAVGLVLALAVLFSVAVGLVPIYLSGSSVRAAHAALLTFSVFLWFGGFVLALLVGAGSVAGDVQPAVNTFWRSRPISPTAWYWTKYVIGLAAIAVAIGLPTLAVLRFTGGVVDVTEKGFLWSLLLWAVAFSFAMTLTCLVRQPMQAGVLSVGAIGLLYVGVQVCCGSFSPADPGAPLAVLLTVFVAALVVSTLAGWWVAVRDWSIE